MQSNPNPTPPPCGCYNRISDIEIYYVGKTPIGYTWTNNVHADTVLFDYGWMMNYTQIYNRDQLLYEGAVGYWVKCTAPDTWMTTWWNPMPTQYQNPDYRMVCNGYFKCPHGNIYEKHIDVDF